MRTFFYIKDRSRNHTVHTSVSYASAGVLLCGCGLKVRDHRIKAVEMGDHGLVPPWYAWCDGCREAFMAEKVAEVLSRTDGPVGRGR